MTKTTNNGGCACGGKTALWGGLLALLVIAGAGALGGILLGAHPSQAEATAAAKTLPERALGNAKAPVTVTMYSSLTCSHCADFFNKILPEVEKKYVETGKLKIVYVDFPTDGIALKAAALAHCMPEAQFFPFVKIVYSNQMSWIKTDKPDQTLIQYAQMAGLDGEKAKACVEDTKLLDALVAARTEAAEKLDVKYTPTLVFSDKETKMVGTRSIEEFSAVVEKVLGKK